MDILSHTLTGVAVGTVVCAFSRGGFKKKALIVLAGGLAGALPDIDAISYWSRFDSTIGSFLGLEHSGREIYTGRWWYSHHGMMHSLFVAILAPLLWWLLGGLISRNSQSLIPRLRSRFQRGKLGMLAFFLAYSFHLLEDMITPAGSWNGVRLFFPLDTYYGGWGKIWWWNNYDLFLIICSVVIVNLIINVINRNKRPLTLMTFSVALLIFCVQLFRREQSTNSGIWTLNEQRSKSLQKEFLGTYTYGKMKEFDNSMNLNF